MAFISHTPTKSAVNKHRCCKVPSPLPIEYIADEPWMVFVPEFATNWLINLVATAKDKGP
jgi:hypothetical protein